jgi:hypothetical protein
MDCPYLKDEEIEKKSDEGPCLIDSPRVNDPDVTEESSTKNEEIHSSNEFQEEKKKESSTTVDVNPASSKIVRSLDEQLMDILRFQVIYSVTPSMIVAFLILLLVPPVSIPIFSPLDDGVHLSISPNFSSRSSRVKTTPFPRYDLIGQQTLHLGKELLDAHSNTAIELLRTKIALVEISSSIVHSQLEQSLREQLDEYFFELKELLIKGIERSTILSASL